MVAGTITLFPRQVLSNEAFPNIESTFYNRLGTRKLPSRRRSVPPSQVRMQFPYVQYEFLPRLLISLSALCTLFSRYLFGMQSNMDQSA